MKVAAPARVRHLRVSETIALAFLLAAAAAVLRAASAGAALQVTIPLGCDKEYIRQMLLSHCSSYRRKQRSLPSAHAGAEGGEGEGDEHRDGREPNKERIDEGLAEGGRDSRVLQFRQRPLHEASDSVLLEEIMAQAELQGDVQRYIRAGKSLLKCCFKGCSWKDFVGVC